MTTQTTALPTGTWELDASATTITVTARKLGLFSIPADLTVAAGTIEIDGDHTVVNVDIVADAASYKSKSTKRNKHVLSDDFLDVATHPTISFRTGAVVPNGRNYRASGTVTIKGQTSPVEVIVTDVQFADSEGSFTASATIDRKAIGVGNVPTFVVAPELELTVSAKATRNA